MQKPQEKQQQQPQVKHKEKNFKIDERVFAPNSKVGQYQPAIITNKFFVPFTNTYTCTCQFLKVKKHALKGDAEKEEADKSTDDEIDNELYKTIEANEIIPFAATKSGDSLLVNVDGVYKNATFLENNSTRAGKKMWLSVQLKRNKQILK